MYWIGIAINWITMNAVALDGESMFATEVSNTMRISSAASIPPTLKTASVGLTCS